MRQQGGVIALRRHRLLRLCEEAFQQGGLLTLEALADLFNCGVRTLVDDLAAVRAAGHVPPLRSTVKDMGRAITHRRQIVERWLAGSGVQVTLPAPPPTASSAVANYVEKYKRCAVLLASGFELDAVATIARLSPALARAFQQLVADAQPVPHRQEELDALTKKNTPVPATPEVRP